MKTEAAMKVENLEIKLKIKNSKYNVVNKNSFTLNKGKVLGLIGESGCGKSVSCLSLMGLLSPSKWDVSGHMELKGQKVGYGHPENMRKLRGRDISIIMQNPSSSFNPLLKIGEHFIETIRAHNKLTRKEAFQISIEMLSKMNISAPERVMSQYPFQLSGGMLQRVMTSIALFMHPAVLIADEPTTSLDVTVQQQILSELSNLKDKYDTAVLIVSHDLGVIAQIADEVAVMYGGYIIEKTNAVEIFHNPLHPYTKALMHSRPAFTKQRLKALDGCPPLITKIGSGCPFFERCEVSEKKCIAYDMKSYGIHGVHTVKCMHYGVHEEVGTYACS